MLGNDMQQQQITITEDNTTEVLCNNCQTGLFEQCIMLRKMSAFVSPNGVEQVVQIPVMVCKNCGSPLVNGEE